MNFGPVLGDREQTPKSFSPVRRCGVLSDFLMGSLNQAQVGRTRLVLSSPSREYKRELDLKRKVEFERRLSHSGQTECKNSHNCLL